MKEKREVILDVRELKQYFKLGSGRNKMVNKAVDGVSFKIYKGEVFSLVGESGCGKTTTGRTIIKLYGSSGGEVYFHGTRIISDVKQAKQAYKDLKLELAVSLKEQTAELKAQLASGNLTQASFDEQLGLLKSDMYEQLAESKAIVNAAKKDSNFERLKSEEDENQPPIEELEEYREIKAQYEQDNVLINDEISKLEQTIDTLNKKYQRLVQNKEDKEAINSAKQELREAKQELDNQKRELKLNNKREKQDINNLAYRLVRKNRLLMRSMQMIFQDPIASLNPRMTVKEIVAEGLRINGVKNEKIIDQKVKEALTTVGLVPEHASRYPHEFSGGQRQRIGIARALIVDPSFIIADEPISALDVSIRAQVINLLNDLREQKGITIMFIAHDLSVVKYFSDRLAVMYFGRIVEMGDKEKIFNNPLHPYTLSLLDSIPLPDPQYEQHRGRTVRYNPSTAHDYSVEEPTMREIEPNHFVLCNTAEFEQYKKQLKK